MLNLARPTDDGWFDRIRPHLDTILVDHCHLEKRAASNALNLIFRYTGRDGLARELSEVVKEEMDHFTLMLDILEAREIPFVRLAPSTYASRLSEAGTKQEPLAFLDKLLIAGLIEARSAERFKILSERLDEPELAEFYASLFATEARHHTLYTTLARRFFDHEKVRLRLLELAELESDALGAATDAPRLHSF
jgi:tRNA-(ms[2]io[6]A)-hydroxylase